MVATRGQAGSDGPVTFTPSAAAPVRPTANLAPVLEAGSTGRDGECAASTYPIASAVSRTQTSQTGTSTRSTQMGPTLQSGLPWLAADDESWTEPEDPYSQGDRPDPLKTGWERIVGGAVGGTRQLVPPHVILVEDTECCEGRVMDPPSLRQNSESRPYRGRYPANCTSASAMLYSAEKGRTEDYGEPEADYCMDRDLWYMQSQLGRPCPETIWGHRMPRSAPTPNAVPAPVYPAPNAVPASVDPVPGEGDLIRGARRHPIPLDAPDVALRGQRLLAHGERLRREEAEAVNT